MGFSTSTCTEFVEVLSSKAPVPGGGGASALVGAVGTALGNMVGSLTVGKKKYADVEDEMWELKKKCDQLQKDFLHLIERDAEVFEPLSKAYGMPRETEEEKAEKASKLEKIIKIYPQVLVGAKVSNDKKYDFDKDAVIRNTIEAVEKEFEGNGRVLIRASGTEPLVRVMIEGTDQEYITEKAKSIAELIEQRLS